MRLWEEDGKRPKIEQEQLDAWLLYESGNGNAENLADALRSGASPMARDQFGRTPLHHASRGGYVSCQRRLIRAGASCDAKDRFGETPLHSAASEGGEEAARELLRAGASPNAKDGEGWTPLGKAARFLKEEMVLEMLRFGGDPFGAGGALERLEAAGSSRARALLLALSEKAALERAGRAEPAGAGARPKGL